MNVRHDSIDTSNGVECRRCGATKPLSEYYANRLCSSGYDLAKCKTCAKEGVRRRRFGPDREKVLAYDRERGGRQGAVYLSEYRARNKMKQRAQSAVGRAVMDGRLVKPDRCSHCHAVAPVHGHHQDYSLPLAVTWLCIPCHRQLHAFIDTIARESGLLSDISSRHSGQF